MTYDEFKNQQCVHCATGKRLVANARCHVDPGENGFPVCTAPTRDEFERQQAEEIEDLKQQLDAIVEISSKFLGADGSDLSMYVTPAYFVQMVVDAASQQAARIEELERTVTELEALCDGQHSMICRKAGRIEEMEARIAALEAESEGLAGEKVELWAERNGWQARAEIAEAALAAAKKDTVRIAGLERELLAHNFGHANVQLHWAESQDRLNARIQSLESKLAEARKDTTRLDWLEAELDNLTVIRDRRKTSVQMDWCFPSTGCPGDLEEETIRAAIDAAMSVEPAKEPR